MIWFLQGVLNLFLIAMVVRLLREKRQTSGVSGSDSETLRALRAYRGELKSLIDEAETRIGTRCRELETLLHRADRVSQDREEQPGGIPSPHSGERVLEFRDHIELLRSEGHSAEEIARLMGRSRREVALALSFLGKEKAAAGCSAD